MSIEIPLHDKAGSIVKTVLISPEDEELIKKYKWHNAHGYASGWVNGKKTRMHHLILGKPTKGMVVDHINRNSLDNRRENLRFATRQQNSQNAEKRKNKQYFGICFVKREQKWKSFCQKYSLGYYINPLDAALVYDKCAYLESVQKLFLMKIIFGHSLNVIEVEQPPIDNEHPQLSIDNESSLSPIDSEPSLPQKLKISIKSHPKIKITLKKKEIKYHGIYYDKKRNKWIARSWNDGKCHYIGQFDNERDAALAYNVKSIELHGELADLNDI